MSNSGQTESKNADQYKLELYKSLRSEASSYIEKIPALWLQKFFLVGATVAFLITDKDKVAFFQRHCLLLIAAILAIPILAALLDVKIFEYTLHARTISRFIATNFTEPLVVQQWENTLWGIPDEGVDTQLAPMRSSITIWVTVVPTMVIIILAALIIGEVSKNMLCA